MGGGWNFSLSQQNRPLNSQNVADFLQKYNLKKAAIQKALDTLADSGRISFKEYGKQKIYLARQDQFDIPNSEELNRMKEENAKLQEKLDDQKKAISEVEGGIILKSFLYIFSESDESMFSNILTLVLAFRLTFLNLNCNKLQNDNKLWRSSIIVM